MRGFKEFRANKVFEGVDKEIRVSYCVEEASTFSFNDGTLTGDVVDGDNPGFQWNVIRKGSRGETTAISKDE